MAFVLIIDDDDALRGSMRRVLERAGHSVKEAADGEEGLRLYREEPTDLVVTDLIMPGKEGIETIQEFRQEFPEIRILAVSGGGSVDPQGPLFDAEALGADDTLAKPFDIIAFQEAVARLLSR